MKAHILDNAENIIIESKSETESKRSHQFIKVLVYHDIVSRRENNLKKKKITSMVKCCKNYKVGQMFESQIMHATTFPN